MDSPSELEIPKLLSPTPSCSSLSEMASKSASTAQHTKKRGENVGDTVETCLGQNVVYRRSTKKAGVYDISEIPDWYDDYQYVLFGYRQFYTFKNLCRNALVTMHNETANIYTELVPAIVQLWISLYYVYYFVITHHDKFSLFSKVLICVCFPFGGLRCLVSAYVHCTHCYSEEHSIRTWNKDYISILTYILSNALMFTYLCGHYASETTSEKVWSTYTPLGISMCAGVSIAVIGVCHLTLRKQKAAKEMIFKIVVVFGNYTVLLYHLVVHCILGYHSIHIPVPVYSTVIGDTPQSPTLTSSPCFPVQFTVNWVCASILTYIAAEIRQAKVPEKWFVAPVAMKTTKTCSPEKDQGQQVCSDEQLVDEWLANDRCAYAALCSKFRKTHNECDCDGDVEGCCDTPQTTHVFQHVSMATAFKFWYFFLLPSHTLWHICTNAAHFLVLYSWIAFFQSRIVFVNNQCL